MGAPYAHPILANMPEEDGYGSNEFAMRSYERQGFTGALFPGID